MEAAFEPEIGNIVGPQKEGSWSGIFWQEPQDKELKEARGRLFLVLVISLPLGFSPPAPLAHALWVHLVLIATVIPQVFTGRESLLKKQ